MSIQTAKDKLIERIAQVAKSTESLEDLSYAATGLAKLRGAHDPIITDPDIYTIGTAGRFGFGVGALRDSDIPTDWLGLPGHDDPNSHNFGNYLDPFGSHMVFIPKFYYRWSGNTVLISKQPAAGFVTPEAFRFCSKGFFRGKTHFGNVAGRAITKRGIAPCSTHANNNPIGNLIGSPPNNFGGVLTAIKLLSADHHAETMFESHALSLISHAHSAASQNTAVCAYKDVLPHLPKGNNNNALGGVNDPSVGFTTSGFSAAAAALAGSGFPFAKTTHNGQACGVADVNGNLWRVNPGLTKLNNTNSIFLILKTSVNPNSLTAANLHDPTLYDEIDLGDLIPSGGTTTIRLGNGTNQVFGDSIDTNSLDFRRSNAGIPLATGVSVAGTTQFGNDSFWRGWVTNLLPMSGGSFGNGAAGGANAWSLVTTTGQAFAGTGGAVCVSF